MTFQCQLQIKWFGNARTSNDHFVLKWWSIKIMTLCSESVY